MAPDPERLGPGRVAPPRAREDGGEVLDTDGPAWTPPPWALGVLAVAVLLGGLAWYGDRHLRAGEERALAACQTRLQSATSLSNQRLNALYDYLRPALSMVSGQPRAGKLMALMEKPAGRVLPSVERAGRTCHAVQVRRWHLTFVARKRAATAYSDALLARIRSIAERGRAYFRSDAALRRLQTAAGVT